MPRTLCPRQYPPANNHDYNYRKARHCRVSLLMRWMGIGLACLLKEEHPLLHGAGNMEEALRFANVGPPFLEQKAGAVQKRWLCRVRRCHQDWDREKCWLTDLIFPIHRARSPEDKQLPIYYQTTLKSEKKNKIRLFSNLAKKILKGTVCLHLLIHTYMIFVTMPTYVHIYMYITSLHMCTHMLPTHAHAHVCEITHEPLT